MFKYPLSQKYREFREYRKVLERGHALAFEQSVQMPWGNQV
jgi:hypothetical protein